ncbi:hypothetical protein Tsp_06609 [Trichinella spiralis]|uniref:hypothetical protein n=1 Tax=Trichinella spiralis TaxID=6334 RepID=UPI0001EFD0C4|nr:hypothetical protein Tsp_06609 [Trichinella spiralis]
MTRSWRRTTLSEVALSSVFIARVYKYVGSNENQNMIGLCYFKPGFLGNESKHQEEILTGESYSESTTCIAVIILLAHLALCVTRIISEHLAQKIIVLPCHPNCVFDAEDFI